MELIEIWEVGYEAWGVRLEAWRVELAGMSALEGQECLSWIEGDHKRTNWLHLHEVVRGLQQLHQGYSQKFLYSV